MACRLLAELLCIGRSLTECVHRLEISTVMLMCGVEWLHVLFMPASLPPQPQICCTGPSAQHQGPNKSGRTIRGKSDT